MSATNSTPNYGLPQYVADDKPTYLGDFNKAMLDIDTNMKSIDNKVVSAESAVETANSNATQAINTANEASQTAQTAQATAEQAQTTATSANQTATSANQTATEARELAQTVKNTVDDIPGWSFSENIALASINSNTPNGKISCNYSESLKLLNIYGYLSFNANQGKCIFAKLPNNIKPNEERTLANAIYDSQNNLELTGYIDTDGNMYINNSSATSRILHMNLMLCINGWN